MNRPGYWHRQRVVAVVGPLALAIYWVCSGVLRGAPGELFGIGGGLGFLAMAVQGFATGRLDRRDRWCAAVTGALLAASGTFVLLERRRLGGGWWVASTCLAGFLFVLAGLFFAVIVRPGILNRRWVRTFFSQPYRDAWEERRFTAQSG